jgi:HCOMODA/2-hydroxy-3-carboxy-muconic semialdehyde decarboxylase
VSDPELSPCAAAISDLIVANRILSFKGVLDAYGHVSIRDTADPHRFVMARSGISARLAVPDDLVEYGLDGRALKNTDARHHSERYIHAEIYRARSDVQAIVHNHSPNLIPFGLAAGVPLKAVFHLAGFLATGVPIFEIRGIAGKDSNMLVDTAERARSLAQSLGSAPVVLMRGHGSTVVGANVRQATFRAIYAEISARLQMQAMLIAGTSPIEYLTKEEGAAFGARGTGGGVNRAWALWQEELSGLRKH